MGPQAAPQPGLTPRAASAEAMPAHHTPVSVLRSFMGLPYSSELFIVARRSPVRPCGGRGDGVHCPHYCPHSTRLCLSDASASAQDEDLRICLVSASSAYLLGLCPDALLGRDMLDAFEWSSERARASRAAALKGAMRTHRAGCVRSGVANFITDGACARPLLAALFWGPQASPCARVRAFVHVKYFGGGRAWGSAIETRFLASASRPERGERSVWVRAEA